MSKKTFLLMITSIFVGIIFLTGNTVSAQEKMMKGNHRMEMMRKVIKGEKHKEDMHGCRMMEGKHPGDHDFFLGMKDELGLSDEQVTKLKALKSESEKQAIRTKADLEILRIELHDLLSQDKVNVKAVDTRIEKMGELQTKMHKVHVHAKLDAKNILTVEQLKKHREMKSKRGMHIRGKDM